MCGGEKRKQQQCRHSKKWIPAGRPSGYIPIIGSPEISQFENLQQGNTGWDGAHDLHRGGGQRAGGGVVVGVMAFDYLSFIARISHKKPPHLADFLPQQGPASTTRIWSCVSRSKPHLLDFWGHMSENSGRNVAIFSRLPSKMDSSRPPGPDYGPRQVWVNSLGEISPRPKNSHFPEIPGPVLTRFRAQNRLKTQKFLRNRAQTSKIGPPRKKNLKRVPLYTLGYGQ